MFGCAVKYRTVPLTDGRVCIFMLECSIVIGDIEPMILDGGQKMRHAVLNVIAIIALAVLSGCATANFEKVGRTAYPPYEGEVRIIDTPLEGINYEVVGIVTVDDPYGSHDKVINRMKKLAAQNGADAIIMCSGKDCLETGDQDTNMAAPAVRIIPKAEVTPPPAPVTLPEPAAVAPAPVPEPMPTEEKAMKEKGRVTLDIQFETNKAAVREEYNDQLARFAGVMKGHPDLKVVIEGHTDNVGNDGYNQALSRKRAESVKNALTSLFGIDASRITAVGYGRTRPIADNGTEEGRRKNRRVEAAAEYAGTVQ